jgi:hypothetical protein
MAPRRERKRPVTILDDSYAFRDEMVARLERDLLGPGEADERLEDFPLERYIVGILYPRTDEPIDPAQDDEPREGEDEDSFPDPPVAMASARYPSSAGFTFAVDIERATVVEVTVEAAMYVSEEAAEMTRWRRRPLIIEPVAIRVDQPIGEQRTPLGEGLELYARVRAADKNNAAAVTLALINTRPGKAGQRDADAFFQPSLTVSTAGTDPAFVERHAAQTVEIDDEDLRSYGLLYRDAKTFAAGHGCSVDWKREAGERCASRVWTTFVPRHALRLADSNPEITSPALSLRRLAQGAKVEVVTELRQFCAAYETWIDTQDDDARTLELDHIAVAEEHLAACRTTLGRIRSGIEILERDPQAWEAFRLANKAMWNQRARVTWIRSGKATSAPDAGGKHEWRPFQLAFILQCLSGLVDSSHADRQIADLLWFPTGGGKTEAYLGLIAFVVFLRRIRNDVGDGVTVLMRYTLRLLTIQQFDRAALLIACCEQIRRDEPRLGPAEISIGLWVGQGGAPNTLAEARAALERLRNDQDVPEGSPVQLHACPWCGATLNAWQYEITTEPRMRIRCRDKSCDFYPGLPVYIVDEDVYAVRPTLVVATSDKFATMPWRPETRNLFNNGFDSPPPELIIQDELHLISGPLGTLAGLYETAIDFLCTDHGKPPKVVASTATIRRAQHQTLGLFTREMRQFPPPGIDARDSWFAVEASEEAKGTRLYVGLMAPGASPATLMIRTYASLLQSALACPGSDGARDPYWTLVGYFNSLRVLGGARMQVQDDVGDRLQLIAGDDEARELEPDSRIELTSRESSSSIPAHLKRMEKAHPDPDALDVILATNMISVGMDIDRLGLMAVMGQPQSTSEYIQATSRVGRQFPGLVVTLLNSGRSRDRSHYESFKGYHSALYRQVESTSVTPFSPRARDRALHAVLIALARLTIPGLSDNDSAGAVQHHRAELDLLVAQILERVKKVDPDAVDATMEELERVIAGWEQRASIVSDLRYSSFKDIDKTLLLDAARAAEAQIGTLPTLWSLRDVDQESNLYLLRN